jgi:GDP-4-dehydro-6-deoxy-D-mannose reductase
MIKSVLIFGASGFVGKYLFEELQANGYTVYGSDISQPRSHIPFEKFFSADILNGKAITDIVQSVKPKFIINLAAISSVSQSWKIPGKTIAVNVEGTINVLEAGRTLAHQPNTLLIGSSEEYAPSDKPLSEDTPLDATNPYGISKVMQEKICDLYRSQYSMKISQVRAFNHTGVGQSDSFVIPSLCKKICEANDGDIVYIGNLNVKRDFSHVEDIVRAYRMIIESEEETVFNVGSEQVYSLSDIFDYIIRTSGKSVRMVVDHALLRQVDTPVIQSDCSKIRSKLGWQPKKNVYNAIDELTKYLLQKPY